jgi:hypothetical protein
MALLVFADGSEASFYACLAWAASMKNVPCPVAHTPFSTLLFYSKGRTVSISLEPNRRGTCNSVPQVKEQGPIIFYTHNKFCPVKDLNLCMWSQVSELADESPMLY